VTTKQQLDSFIAKYSLEVASVARQGVAWMRKKFPRAFVLVYDNYNALAIGFGPTERASDSVFSIALFPRWVNLFFLQGAGLPDPHKLLKGNGKQARSMRLENVELLDEPAVLALIDAAATVRVGAWCRAWEDRDQIDFGQAASATALATKDAKAPHSI
jgi:hypothetical protein